MAAASPGVSQGGAMVSREPVCVGDRFGGPDLQIAYASFVLSGLGPPVYTGGFILTLATRAKIHFNDSRGVF